MKLGCILLVVVFAVACGKKEATPIASTAAAQPSASPAVAPPTATAAPPASASALATADKQSGTARAELIELKQTSGGLLMLRVSIVNTGGTDLLNGSMEYSDPELTGNDYGSVGGIHLIDPLNKKKYFVVRDADNKCVCTRNFPGSTKPGERVNFWARFPAPPEDVRKLSVIIPTFPPMDDVTIAR